MTLPQKDLGDKLNDPIYLVYLLCRSFHCGVSQSGACLRFSLMSM